MVGDEHDESNPFAAPESDLASSAVIGTVDVSESRYASFWERVAAMIVDGILIEFILASFGAVMGIGLWSGFTGIEIVHDHAIDFIFGILVPVTTWTYFVLQESSSAQGTVGKRMMGLKVVDVSGGKLTLGRGDWPNVLERSLVCHFLCLIGFLIQPFTDRGQALHDVIAGTLVIKR